MGYHLIIRRSNGTIACHYSDSFEGLCEFDGITKDSIVYQAAKEWAPSVIELNSSYQVLAEEWFRAGIRAQWLFFEEAKQLNLIPEKISQDKQTFQAYTSAATSRIKRGDYLLRAKNIEVEVKCLTLYNDNHFYLPYSDIKAHQSMQSLSTTPVWFAIYEKQGDNPVSGSLRMISLNDILRQNNGQVSYDKNSQCLVIPKAITSQGFNSI